MLKHDPKQFITECLSLPRRAREPSPTASARVFGRNASKTSVQFLKESSLPHYQVHVLTYEDSNGLMWDYISFLDQDELGYWHDAASARSRHGLMKQATCSSPWVHIVGNGWETWEGVGATAFGLVVESHGQSH